MLSEQSCIRKRWAKAHSLIFNRLACANQMHGCRYDSSPANPCVLVCEGAHYRIDYGGMPLVRWRAYDLASAESALDFMDNFNGALWRVSVAGYLLRV